MKPCYGTFGGLDGCRTCIDTELCAISSGDVTLENVEKILTRLSVTDPSDTDITDRIFSLYPDPKSWRYRALIHLRLMGKSFSEIAISLQQSERNIMFMMNHIDAQYPQIGFSLRRMTLWESTRMYKKPKR